MLAIIKCSSYTHVARSLFSLNLSEFPYAMQSSSKPTFLILSNLPLKKEKIDLPLNEFLPESTFQKSHSKRKSLICQSIEKVKLDSAPKPYLYLFQIISQLKYEYHKARLITDPYGKQYLVFYKCS